MTFDMYFRYLIHLFEHFHACMYQRTEHQTPATSRVRMWNMVRAYSHTLDNECGTLVLCVALCASTSYSSCRNNFIIPSSLVLCMCVRVWLWVVSYACSVSRYVCVERHSNSIFRHTLSMFLRISNMNSQNRFIRINTLYYSPLIRAVAATTANKCAEDVIFWHFSHQSCACNIRATGIKMNWHIKNVGVVHHIIIRRKWKSTKHYCNEFGRILLVRFSLDRAYFPIVYSVRPLCAQREKIVIKQVATPVVVWVCIMWHVTVSNIHRACVRVSCPELKQRFYYRVSVAGIWIPVTVFSLHVSHIGYFVRPSKKKPDDYHTFAWPYHSNESRIWYFERNPSKFSEPVMVL